MVGSGERDIDGDPEAVEAKDDGIGEKEYTPEGVSDSVTVTVLLNVETPVVAMALGEREGGPAEEVANPEVGMGEREIDGDPEAVEAKDDAIGEKEYTPVVDTDSVTVTVPLNVETPVVAMALGEREGGPAEKVEKAEVGMGEGLGLKDTVTDSVSEDV